MKKNIIILSILIIFILLIIVFIKIDLIKKYFDADIQHSIEDTTKEDNFSNIKFSEMTDVEIYKIAIENNNENSCNNIENENNKNLCYKQLAIDKNELSICDNISEDNVKNQCMDTILLNEAKINNDLSICENLSKKSWQINCVELLINENMSIEDCNKISSEILERTPENMFEFDLREYCISMILYKNAIIGTDVANCNSITRGEIKARCYASIENISLGSDDDNDGLMYRDEIIYGTDPESADTDGDGFLDGEEVKNEFNPKGEGDINELYFNLNI